MFPPSGDRILAGLAFQSLIFLKLSWQPLRFFDNHYNFSLLPDSRKRRVSSSQADIRKKASINRPELPREEREGGRVELPRPA
jgi:hypothetical protein